jgi:hypothetical protein
MTVATFRAPAAPPEFFSKERTFDNGCAVFDVPDREVGTVRFPATVRGEVNRLGPVRAADGRGGLDVAVIALPRIGPDHRAGHMKSGTSPEVIAFIQRIRDRGGTFFPEGRKAGLPEPGGALIPGGDRPVHQPDRKTAIGSSRSAAGAGDGRMLSQAQGATGHQSASGAPFSR